jgi:hypothetical protein
MESTIRDYFLFIIGLMGEERRKLLMAWKTDRGKWEGLWILGQKFWQFL